MLTYSLPMVGPIIRGARSTPIHVVGGSMYPLLNSGDRVLLDPGAYHGRLPHRGDIVLFSREHSEGERMIKLVAGLPGEHIEVRGDRLWINERPLQFQSPMVGSLPGQWQLSHNEWFALSIAVAIGTDSRSFGPVALSALLGQVWYVLPPSRRAGPLPTQRLDLGRQDSEQQKGASPVTDVAP